MKTDINAGFELYRCTLQYARVGSPIVETWHCTMRVHETTPFTDVSDGAWEKLDRYFGGQVDFDMVDESIEVVA